MRAALADLMARRPILTMAVVSALLGAGAAILLTILETLGQ